MFKMVKDSYNEVDLGRGGGWVGGLGVSTPLPPLWESPNIINRGGKQRSGVRKNSVF